MNGRAYDSLTSAAPLPTQFDWPWEESSSDKDENRVAKILIRPTKYFLHWTTPPSLQSTHVEMYLNRNIHSIPLGIYTLRYIYCLYFPSPPRDDTHILVRNCWRCSDMYLAI